MVDLKQVLKEQRDMADKKRDMELEIKNLKAIVANLSRGHHTHRIDSTADSSVKFALISDIHSGNSFHNPRTLKLVFDFCLKEGFHNILCAGDVHDGINMYREQQFECAHYGFEPQMKLFKRFPYHRDIVTHFIAGNHDSSFFKAAGLEVGKHMQELREDWHYLGQDAADITFTAKDGRPYKVALLHPDGGTAYAISYHMQKIIESLSGGDKPNMMVVGHYHKADQLPSYRNVCGIQAGTLCDQTPFMKRKHIAAMMGFWLIEVLVGSRRSLTNRIKAEFIPFY